MLQGKPEHNTVFTIFLLFITFLLKRIAPFALKSAADFILLWLVKPVFISQNILWLKATLHFITR